MARKKQAEPVVAMLRMSQQQLQQLRGLMNMAIGAAAAEGSAVEVSRVALSLMDAVEGQGDGASD